MDKDEINEWTVAHNLVNDENAIQAELPTSYPIGGRHLVDNKIYQRVRVISGPAGSRWAYWVGASHRAEKVHPNARYEVIADTIFNGDAWHFAGMLIVPYAGKVSGESEAWILVEPRVKEVPIHPHLYNDVERYSTLDGKRYEKSKE